MSYNGRYVHDLTLRGEAPAGPSTTPNADGGSQWLNPDIMDTPARVRMGRIHTSWQHRQNDLSTPVADGFSQAITRKTALDDVVNPTADSLFSPAQDINFKRDFGEWFQPDDAVTPYGMLERRASLGASHNSDERRDPPRCLSGTRDLVLKKIMDWLQSGSDSKIMWMYGRAGAGKSAIAQTIADLCSAKQLLAASFFWFRAAHGRNDETRVISTLAYQLVLEIPEIRRLVEKAIEEDSLLLSRPLEKQLEDLIIKPLNKMVLTKKNAISLPFRPRFIILDGLDECGTPSAQCRILRLLLSAINDLKFPLRFLVASRPEKAIEEEFSGDLSLQTIRLSLDETYPSDTDIGMFLEAKFKEINETHPGRGNFPPLWPSSSDLECLARQASGSFIFAQIATKFIASNRHSPAERLHDILKLGPPPRNPMPPYLDSLYYHILSSVDISKVSNILSLLLLFQLERKASVLMGSTLFGSRNEEADDTLSQLESIISIPSNDYSQLRIIHTTVSDFLLDRWRSERFFVDLEVSYSILVNLCIDALNSLNSPSRTSTRYRYRDLNMHDLRLIFMKNYSKLRPEYIGPRFLLFDFVQHLHWCVEASITEGPQFNGQVPDFLTWVMQMHYMHRSISPHQLDSIDEWFHIQLSLYPQEVYTTHLLAVISLVDISMPFLQIFDVLTAHVDTQEVSLFKRIDNIRLSLLQLSENVHTSYRSLISGFLLDHLRAKKYFIGMDRQIALAKHILVFLSELPGNSGEILPDDLPLAKVTLNLIPLILPHSPKVWELVECMERHLLPHMKLNMSICSEIKLAARAIDIYQQEYHATHSTFEP